MTSIESNADATADQADNAEVTQEKVDPGNQNVTIKWRGEDLDLPLDKVTQLAQKGYDYEKKTAELSEQRRDLEARSAELAGLDQFQQFLEANPEKATAIQRIIQGQQVEDFDFDGEGGNTVNPSDMKVTQLENQLRMLMAQQAEVTNKTELATLKSRIDAAVASSPTLARSSDHATHSLLQEMTNDPTLDLDLLVKHLESTFNRIIENPNANEIAAGLRERARFGAESGGGASGATPDIPNLSAEDMRKGGTAKAAVDYLSGLLSR